MSRAALHALLRDLPPDLQRAVHQAVARCRPQYRPCLYAHDWREELYHEAACAACEAWRSYDPAKGSLWSKARIFESEPDTVIGRRCENGGKNLSVW